jgi:hypothetical protein
MKRYLGIILIFLILVSGMQLSIATHYCGGHLAGVRWSFSGQLATCGMENSKSTCPSGNKLNANCCQNKIYFFNINNNYSPSSFQSLEISKKLIRVFEVPISFFSNSTYLSSNVYADISPPDNPIYKALSLTDIGVFRI